MRLRSSPANLTNQSASTLMRKHSTPGYGRNVPLRGRDASWLGGEFHSIAEVSQSFNQAVFLPLFAT